mmetsp:Transcript_15046/g.34983  ORF Transcript_15046/g.34983 Transcript_15046/m.34983 type:complete len:275 (+) Transcript_15046:2613-3437(+)
MPLVPTLSSENAGPHGDPFTWKHARLPVRSVEAKEKMNGGSHGCSIHESGNNVPPLSLGSACAPPVSDSIMRGRESGVLPREEEWLVSPKRIEALTTRFHSMLCEDARCEEFTFSGATCVVKSSGESDQSMTAASHLRSITHGILMPGPLSPSARNVESSVLMKITATAPAAAALRAFSVNGTMPRVITAIAPRSAAPFTSALSASGGSVRTMRALKEERGPKPAKRPSKDGPPECAIASGVLPSCGDPATDPSKSGTCPAADITDRDTPPATA